MSTDNMIKNFAIFTSLVCMVLLVSCLENASNQNRPVLTTTELSSISTSTPFTTITPTTASAVPTFTPRALPPSIPTLIPSGTPLSFELTVPPAKRLLELLDVLNSQYSYYSMFYDDDGNPKFGFMLDELSDFLTIMNGEIRLHYPDGFPEPEVIWSYYPFSSHDNYPFYPAAYLDSLTDAVLHKINRLPNRLEDQQIVQDAGYSVQFYQVELDHDPQPEWLVRMDWQDLYAVSWLVLDQTPDGHLNRLKQSLPDLPWVAPTSSLSLEALQDFTGDGLTDLIFLNQGYMAGTDSYSFYVAQGTRNGFQKLDEIKTYLSVTEFSGDPAYKVEKTAGSKWLTLIVSDPHNINWDCTWNTQTSYSWPNRIEQVITTWKDIPRSPECSLARAVQLYDAVGDSRAIRFLEDAVARFDNKDQKQFEKALFAHYRLAVLYSLSDKQFLARQHLQWLVDNLPDANAALRTQLTSLLETPSINAISLCDRLYNAPVSEFPSSWENYLTATAALHAYPLSNEIYPAAICPLQNVISYKLKHVNLTQQPNTARALAQQGIPAALITMYPFPNLDRAATFMLIGEQKKYAVGYVPIHAGWEWKILEEFDVAKDPLLFFEDVTGDGFPELAYFQQYPYWYCSEGKQSYKIFLTTFAGTGFVSLNHQVCNPNDKKFEITDYLPDENGDGIVDWVPEEIKQSAGGPSLSAQRAGPAIWFTPDEVRSYMTEASQPQQHDDLIERLYSSKSIAAIRKQLIDKRTQLNPDQPYADHQWQKLTFLIAVSYEMDGDKPDAILEFQSIIQAKEHTLWGNLAQLHLSIKE